MSLSTCQKCGGHIPLGPDATNRCEKCGASVWLEIHGEPAMNQINKMHARLAEAERLLRLTLKTTLCTYEEPDLRDIIYAFLEFDRLDEALKALEES